MSMRDYIEEIKASQPDLQSPNVDPMYPSLTPSVYAQGLEKLSLDEVVSMLVQCDDEYCPEYEYGFMEGVEQILRVKWPQLELDMIRCKDENRPDGECLPLMEQAMSRAGPVLVDMVNQKRMKTSPDPLVNYNGLQYLHQFWFTGVGEIWRRVSHGSRKYSVKDCKVLMGEAEKCLGNLHNLQPDDKSQCLQRYAEASACESGTICPYLRIPLLVCMSRADFKGADESQYKVVQECYHDLPNYSTCKVQYVPLTPETYEILGLDSLSV